MDMVSLFNQDHEKFSTEVVRYFNLKGKKYFIFTLNEKDEQNYIKLYVARIDSVNGKLVMNNIIDENEWSDFKSYIQTIVTNNRNNVLNTCDVDFNELNNMEINEFRIFKLRDSICAELSSRKNVVSVPKEEVVEKEPVISKEPQTLEAASATQSELSIEEILKQVSAGARSSKEVSNVAINTIEPVVESVKPIVDNVQPEVVTPHVHHDVSFDSFNSEMVNTLSDDKTVISTPIPEPRVEEIDYKNLYERSLTSMRNMEKESMRLLNELIETKAKLETIKDIINQ